MQHFLKLPRMCEPFNKSSLLRDFVTKALSFTVVQCTTHYPCTIVGCTTTGLTHTIIGLMMTRNVLPGGMSHVSKCIRQMDVYGYADNLMNQWNLHASRRLFKVVATITWSVCSWHDVGALTLLQATLTSDRYISRLPDYLHSLMSVVLSDRL